MPVRRFQRRGAYLPTRKRDLVSVSNLIVETSLVSAASAEEAHRRQNLLGGTFEGHLLRLKALTEEELVGAIRSGAGCDAIALSGLPIPESVIGYLPRRFAEQRCLLPVAFDPAANRLTVACLDPRDEGLAAEIRAVTGVQEIHLAAALEPVLRCRIIEAYRNRPEVDDTRGAAGPDAPPAPRRPILLVGAIDPAVETLARALALEGQSVILVETVDEALAEIAAAAPRAVVVRSRPNDTHAVLEDHLRATAPQCPVCFAEGVADLITAAPPAELTGSLFTAALAMWPAGAAPADELKVRRVAERVDLTAQLCDRLKLSPRDRLLVVHAAIAAGAPERPPSDRRPPEVAAILAHRESEIADTYADRLPLAVLGGSILRLVDTLADRWGQLKDPTPELYRALTAELRPLRGQAFLPQVVDAFIAMVSERIPTPRPFDRASTQALVLGDADGYVGALAGALAGAGFEVLRAGTAARFIDLYGSRWPDFLVIVSSGSARDARRMVDDLADRGIAFDTVPALLAVPTRVIRDLADLLDSRIEDILPIEAGPELGEARLRRLRLRLEAEHSRQMSMLQSMGTHGSLADMNLIDLLQALGYSQRTVRISVTACGAQLTMYLDGGRLIWAECGDTVGAEAVYLGLGWARGIWSVDPVGRESLPEPNSHLPIDALLIEGCHRLDEGGGPGTVRYEELPAELPPNGDLGLRET